jgi:hypothetical protein
LKRTYVVHSLYYNDSKSFMFGMIFTTDFTDFTDGKPVAFYPCHPRNPWLHILGYGSFGGRSAPARTNGHICHLHSHQDVLLNYGVALTRLFFEIKATGLWGLDRGAGVLACESRRASRRHALIRALGRCWNP